jgi:hypothetical protein
VRRAAETIRLGGITNAWEARMSVTTGKPALFSEEIRAAFRSVG